MPEWLLKEENYNPQADKDTFINKSILSLLSLVSRIKNQSGHKTDKFFVNSSLKVFFTFMLIVLLSISRSFAFIVVIVVYLLVLLSMMEGDEIFKILRVSFIMSCFTFIILLPAALSGNSYSSVMITTKVFATITAVNILSYSSKWHSITSALKRFFMPDLFILVLDITIKYISMLGEFSVEMLYSLRLRSVGRNKGKYSSLAGVVGTMFIKSTEMAEEMYSAMECRGFTGEYQLYDKFKFNFADLIYIIINVGIVFTFIYLGRA